MLRLRLIEKHNIIDSIHSLISFAFFAVIFVPFRAARKCFNVFSRMWIEQRQKRNKKIEIKSTFPDPTAYEKHIREEIDERTKRRLSVVNTNSNGSPCVDINI